MPGPPVSVLHLLCKPQLELFLPTPSPPGCLSNLESQPSRLTPPADGNPLIPVSVVKPILPKGRLKRGEGSQG